MKQFITHFLLAAKLLLRMPGYWVPAVIFPSMLFSFFGVSSADDPTRSAYAMASFCIYAIVGVTFYQFGAGIAQQRETAFDVWSRTLPGSRWPSLMAKLVTASLFGLVSVASVIAVAFTLSSPAVSGLQLAQLVGVCAVAAIPASLMGITLGYLASSRTAVAIANMVFLPLAYLGGLWVPPGRLPDVIDTISQYTPTRHMGELAWHVIAKASIPTESLIAIAAFTALFGVTAWLGVKTDTKRRFG